VSQRWRKYSPEFRARALELLKSCASVSGLARELGIRRKWLYKWRDEARAKPARTSGDAKSPAPAEAVREPENGALRQRVADLERLVGRQTAEIDFFRRALRRVEDRRQSRGETGGEASTKKSGS
jgi:transposase